MVARSLARPLIVHGNSILDLVSSPTLTVTSMSEAARTKEFRYITKGAIFNRRAQTIASLEFINNSRSHFNLGEWSTVAALLRAYVCVPPIVISINFRLRLCPAR